MVRRLLVACLSLFLFITSFENAFSAEVSIIQRGTTTMTGTSTSVTIEPVCTSQSILFFSATTNAANPRDVAIGGELVDETTITFHRDNAGATVNISWQVVEFESGVSVQRGVASGFNASGTNITINAVNTASSFAMVTAIRDGTSWSSDDGITADITSSTNLFVDVNAGTAGSAYWQVIEYNGASVQKLNTTLGAGNTSTTETITVVDMSKTFIVSSQQVGSTVNADDLDRVELTNTTTVTYTRVGQSGNLTYVTYVVELGDASTVTRGTTSFASGATTANIAVTADLEASIVNCPGSQGRQGSTSHSSNDNLGHVWFTYELTSATNLLISRATGSGSTADATYEIINFEDTHKQTTYYSFASGAWDVNTSWSLTSDGSSGAVAVGDWPRRFDDVVVKAGHIITVDAIDDNMFCGVAADNLNRANVGTGFPGGTVDKFYHTGDLLIEGTLVSTNGIGVMFDGYTYVDNGGTLQSSGAGTNDDILNLGFMEIASTATLTVGDDLQMSGNSITIIDNATIAVDDIYLDNTDATLCGDGSATIADDVQFFNGATDAQICAAFVIMCGGTCATGSGTFVDGNIGPGGVGDSDNNQLWLMADQGTFSDAGSTATVDTDPVQQWNDQSGNGNNASASGTERPTYRTSIQNSLPVLRFDGSDDRLLSTGLTTGDGATVFASTQYLAIPSAASGIIHAAPAGSAFGGGNSKTIGMWLISGTSMLEGLAIESGGTQRVIPQTTALTASTWYSLTNLMDVNATNVDQFVSNTQAGAVAYDGTLQDWSDFGIGRQATSTWDGDISEVIAYNGTLNDAQRLLVDNYLAAKWNFSLSSNDIYTMDNSGQGNYDFEVAGVGQAVDGSNHRDARGPGIVRVFNPSDLDDDDWLIFGHDGTSLNDANTVDVDGTVIEARLDRQWRLRHTGDIGTVGISFDVSSFSTLIGSDLRLLIDRDADGFMDNDVTPIAGSFAGDIVTFSGVAFQNDDIFTLGTADATNSPLPIELASLKAIPVSTGVSIQWSTASETNNDFFTVERSSDLRFWSEVANVDGAGFSTETLNYEVLDDSKISGLTYYRLKQTDFDGAYEYSHTVSVYLPEGDLVTAYPNPFDDSFIVTNTEKYKLQNVRVVNMLGQSQSVGLSRSGTEIHIDAKLLQDGVYLLELRNGFSSKVIRLLKQ